MATQLLDEAERFLLDNWRDARRLEESMESVRTKYRELVQRVIEAAASKYPEFDSARTYVTQHWSNGYFGLARKIWPDGDTDSFPGIWFDNLRLETLSSEETDSPVVYLWISSKTAKKVGIDLTEARAKLVAGARKLLVDEDFGLFARAEMDKEILLVSPLLSKHEILQLFAEGDGERFVAAFMTQIDQWSRFLPLMDSILLAKNG